MLNLIAAIDDKNGLADDNGIPWKLSKDKKYFKTKTDGGIVVMGYRTYLEFPKPLVGRENFVLTHSDEPLREGFRALRFLDQASTPLTKQTLWIIGGAKVYASTINYASRLYLTRVSGDFKCTKFFPKFTDQFSLDTKSKKFSENGVDFVFEVWKRKV